VEFSKILKYLRKKNNLTQNGLADKLSIAQPIVSEWENGEKLPHFDNLIKLAKVFDISTDELMGVKENKELSRFCRIEQLSHERKLSIEDLRKENNISFDELAKLLMVSPGTLLNWEKKGLPNIDKYKKIILYFDLTLEQFTELK